MGMNDDNRSSATVLLTSRAARIQDSSYFKTSSASSAASSPLHASPPQSPYRLTMQGRRPNRAQSLMDDSGPHRVSEIVNPDGSMTVRSLILNADGSDAVQQDIVQYSPGRKHMTTTTTGSSITAMESSYETGSVPSEMETPSLVPANSWESSQSSNSTYRSRRTADHSMSEVSEGAAHELRRQRLARSRKRAPVLDGEPTESLYAPSRQGLSGPVTSTNVVSSFRYNLSANTPSDSLVSSPPRPKRTTAGKQVAFLEPTTSLLSNPIRSDFSSGDGDGGGGGSSMGYPILDTSRSTNASASESATTNEGSTFFNTRSGSSDESTDVFEDLHYGKQQLLSSSPGRIKRMSRKAGNSNNNNYYYGQYLLSPGKENYPGSGEQEVYSTPNASLDEILGPLPKPSTADTSRKSTPLVVADDEEVTNVHNLQMATVHKASAQDKIGIYVGIQRLEQGARLVVSRISPTGKLANSKMEPGDVVVSINGQSFLERPSSQLAYDIVKNATGQITFVYRKGDGTGEIDSVAETSVSSITKDFVPPLSSGVPNTEPSTDHKRPQRPQAPVITQKMSPDGSMLITKGVETTKPNPILSNESWKISGAIVVGVKKSSASEKPGIRIGVMETSNGRVLFVSDIAPSSPFAATPLRVGDVVLSINSVNLREIADVVDAYAALGRSGREVTIVARKAENSLKEFLVSGQSVESSLPGTPRLRELKKEELANDAQRVTIELGNLSPSRKEKITKKDFAFDEASYGSALFGYNSSKSVKLVKSDPLEDIGIDLTCLSAEWGKFLIVSKIVPNGKVATTTDIQVGDAIVAINGVNFREHPNVPRATLLITRARRDVFIEYQKLASFSPAVPITESSREAQPKDDHDDKHEEVDYNEMLTIVSLSDDDEGQHNDAAKPVGVTGASSIIDVESAAKGAVAGDLSSVAEGSVPESVKKKAKRVWVTVTKENKHQQVGISLATMNGSLFVTKVSPTGMLRGAPILPGDTILSINRKTFRHDPDAREAFELILNALTVTIELSKTGYNGPSYLLDASSGDDDGKNKSCLVGNLFCGRHKREDRLHAVRKARLGGEKETLRISPTINSKDLDPLYA